MLFLRQYSLERAVVRDGDLAPEKNDLEKAVENEDTNAVAKVPV